MSSKASVQRNGKIDFLRFVFAIFIMILHSGYRPELNIGGVTLKIGERGGFGVVFFFIVSGYLLSDSVNRYDKGDYESDNVHFIIKKYKQYMTWYLPAFVLCALLDGIQSGWGNMLKNCLRSIPSLMLLGSVGYSSDAKSIGYYVGASWYISALFISQIILYPLMRWNYNRFIKIFAPILFIITFSMDVLGKGDNISHAICCILMGQFSYVIVKQLSGYIIGSKWCYLFKIIELLLYFMCFIYMSMGALEDMAYGMRFIVAAGVVLSFSHFTEYGVFKYAIFGILGRISFPMYLLHIQILRWFEFVLKDCLVLIVPDTIYFPMMYNDVYYYSIIIDTGICG